MYRSSSTLTGALLDGSTFSPCLVQWLYYEIDDSRRKQMMCHLGDHLCDFRRKLYAKFIQPIIGNPKKLKVVPKQYEGIVKEKHWKKFVEWRLSAEYKDVSKSAKQSRAKAKYPHRLGRLGYSVLREKLVSQFAYLFNFLISAASCFRFLQFHIKNNELVEDEDDIPIRSFMWRKARETKDGEYKDDDVKNVAKEIISHEKEIAKGSVKPDQCVDALTLVFGKDHSGRVRGVGRGVTPTKYWNIPRRKGSSNERIAELEKQLDVERQRSESAIEEVKHLSAKIEMKDEESKQLSATVKEQDLNLMHCILSLFLREWHYHHFLLQITTESLTSDVPSSHPMPPRQSTQVADTSSQHSSRSRQEPSNAIMSSHVNSHESENIVSQVLPTKDPMTCQQAYPFLRNIVARGRVYYSLETQTIHGVALKDDCYKVSIDESVKSASFLPIQAGEHKTVEDAIHSFVAWPKDLVIPDKVSRLSNFILVVNFSSHMLSTLVNSLNDVA
ncbi:hypothetical protein OSB04_031703 [Centaurea solstitialis]|uniref:DUF8039 domain-containing protein n=1 Tax=Centaurea solstitialis TaxID=347529 RepID=A0AA38W501_9ASTR|nr:hypothetical protein OSB04_031703 [Centaurea solstitialis]